MHNLSTKLGFLKWLVSLGPLAPQAMAIFVVWMNKVSDATAEFTAALAALGHDEPHPMMAAAEGDLMAGLSDKESAALDEAVAVLNEGGPKGAAAGAEAALPWDGTKILQIWAFVQQFVVNNPALVQWLLSLFAKKP